MSNCYCYVLIEYWWNTIMNSIRYSFTDSKTYYIFRSDVKIWMTNAELNLTETVAVNLDKSLSFVYLGLNLNLISVFPLSVSCKIVPVYIGIFSKNTVSEFFSSKKYRQKPIRSKSADSNKRQPFFCSLNITRSPEWLYHKNSARIRLHISLKYIWFHYISSRDVLRVSGLAVEYD